MPTINEIWFSSYEAFCAFIKCKVVLSFCASALPHILLSEGVLIVVHFSKHAWCQNAHFDWEEGVLSAVVPLQWDFHVVRLHYITSCVPDSEAFAGLLLVAGPEQHISLRPSEGTNRCYSEQIQEVD